MLPTCQWLAVSVTVTAEGLLCTAQLPACLLLPLLLLLLLNAACTASASVQALAVVSNCSPALTRLLQSSPDSAAANQMALMG
jgi:membrane-bound ClpP family serine protease